MDYNILCKNAIISARSLRSLVIIYEISQVSDIFFSYQGRFMSITDKSTLLYQYDM